MRLVFLIATWIAGVLATAPSLAASDDVVVVVLDDSGSMKGVMGTDRGKMTRINAAKQALRTILGQLPESTQLGIRLLNGASGNQHWLVALGPIDRKSAIAKVDQIRADGGTPLGAAMKTAMDELLQIRKRQASGTYRLLVITDGEANDSRLLETYLPDMLSRGILIDVVGWT